MKRIFKNKFLTCLIAAVFALLAAVFAILPFSKTTTAQAYDVSETEVTTDCIGNIFD